MQKPKSLLKKTALATVMLQSINLIIDSTANTFTKKTDGKFYHWKHGDIYYKKTGEGKPILLIHDLTVFSSGYEWSRITDSLSKKYTVYVIDLLGCGKSDKPKITYTNFFYVQMIRDFIKDVIGTKTKVAATGLSGSVVLMANSVNKELFSEIVLINPKSVSSLRKTPDERSKILLSLFNLPIFGKTAYYIAVNRPNTEYYLTEKCFYNPFTLNKSIINAYYNAAHSASGRGKYLLSSIEGNYVNADVSNALSGMEIPLTLVFGEHLEGKAEIELSYTGILPETWTEEIPDTKCVPQLENPEAILPGLN